VTPRELAALHAACFTTPRPWTKAEFESFLAAPHVFLLGDAQGFVVGRAVAGEAELLTLAVAPGARRQGLGRALLAGFEAESRARGAAEAYLEVAEDNAPAQRLYAAAGYRVTGRRPGYFRSPDGAPVAALLMARAL
jgi:[ribosomal protein S18]-alanine N-acetyltransferase